jgi:hypothetical protein
MSGIGAEANSPAGAARDIDPVLLLTFRRLALHLMTALAIRMTALAMR